MQNRLHFQYVHCVTTQSPVERLSPALLHIYNAFAPWLCREETVLYNMNMLHGIPTQRMPINYPNHDVFLFASFLAACYSRSSARSLVSMVTQRHRQGQKLVSADFGTVGSNIPIVLYNLCRLFFFTKISIVPSLSSRLLTGRNPYTLPSLLHCASGIVCSCPRLLDTGRSIRCMLYYSHCVSRRRAMGLKRGQTCRIWWRLGRSTRRLCLRTWRGVCWTL
jgi:hypothetical protein